jgi:DNA-binding CsgD family transcriptional regulator
MGLVGRSVELDLLRRSLDNCLDGRGSVVMVTGPVGAGKTELLRTFAREAVGAGVTFLSATASRTERVLPLGVLNQLLVGADLPAERAEQVDRLVTDGAVTAMLNDQESEATQQVTAPVLHGLTTTMLELAERTPLLVGVDDVQFADLASLQSLLYLVPRAVRARILLVVTEAARARQARPIFRADLLSQPQCRQIRLGLLAPDGVTGILAERLDSASAHRLGPACQQISGGNPLLVDALIEDFLASGGPAGEPVVGETFGQAVMTCLYRSEFTLLRLARVLAVLDGPAPSTMIAELLGIDPASTDRAIDTATDAGLLRAKQFRHARARVAVLDAMSPEERADLHERTAYLLYKHGAPAVAVARHEIAGDHVGASWSVPVLREAAEHALAEDDTTLALECLRLAARAGVAGTERAATEAALVRAQWRVDPRTAERHATGLLEAARNGHLNSRQAAELVTYLLWYGRLDEALELFDLIRNSARPSDMDTATALYSAGAQLAYIYPALSGRLRDGDLPPRPPVVGGSASNLSVRAATLVHTLLTEGIGEQAVSEADCVLQQARLDDASYISVLAAVETLVFADHLDTVASWCVPMLREAEARRARAWCALLATTLALVSLRRGELADAEQHAGAALSHPGPRSLGVFVGMPLAALLLVESRAGRYREGLTTLAVPVPEAMLQTRFGLQYIRARGRYHLARENHEAAIADFETCRDLIAGWGLDLPGTAPWRIDLAEAYLAVGRLDSARELAREQMSRLGPFGSRDRGTCLRILAAPAEPGHRPTLLREPTEALENIGTAPRRADARAEASARRAIPHQPAGDQDRPMVGLSDAERRVAALAAQGRTNRQIARELHVTVSTVEQHLTRVYRKLRVGRRTDLPVKLLCDLG